MKLTKAIVQFFFPLPKPSDQVGSAHVRFSRRAQKLFSEIAEKNKHDIPEHVKKLGAEHGVTFEHTNQFKTQ